MQIMFLCKGSSNIEFNNYKSIVNAIYLKLFLPCSFEILYEWSQNYVMKFYDFVNYGFLISYHYGSLVIYHLNTFLANHL